MPQATITIRLISTSSVSSIEPSGLGRRQVPEIDALLGGGALAEGLGDRVSLLVDLLEHEGLIALLLGGFGVPADLGDLAGQRPAVGGQEVDAAWAQDDDLVVLYVLDEPGLLEERRGSRSQ